MKSTYKERSDSKIPRKIYLNTNKDKTNLIPKSRYLILSKQRLEREAISGLIMEVNALSFKALDKLEKIKKPIQSIKSKVDNPEVNFNLNKF